MKACCKAYLDEQFGGDEEVVTEIYNEYVDSAKTKIDEAKKAIADKEWQPLDKIAHTIKGNALAAGDEEMANIAIELRSAAHLQDEGTATTLVARLEELSGLL
jgi:HPt (histidine-containing phosphotransfer) domain-containing protein